jgi:predicted KAP-like P-loop ATPase
LAKVLLFERCGDPKAYAALIKSVMDSDQGKPVFLADWERGAIHGESLALKAPWDEPFITDWLRLPPQLGDRDLRGVLYVSREHMPLIMPEDSLSSETVELLWALLEHPDMAGSVKDRLGAVESRQHIPIAPTGRFSMPDAA